MIRLVADLGNSRLKWGLLDCTGRLTDTRSLPVDEPAAWSRAWDAWQLSSSPTSWAVSTVNPPVADQLGRFLESQSASHVRWFRSAADVPVPHQLERPETAGADRALAVLAARELMPAGQLALVVSCGSAIVVERISSFGLWEGGAIAAGLGLSARALHHMTAQLPLVSVTDPPNAWGTATVPAVEAGVFWGTVGAIRELIARQCAGMGGTPAVIWTGGDAPLLAPWASGAEARVVPDLVLMGAARASREADVLPQTP